MKLSIELAFSTDSFVAPTDYRKSVMAFLKDSIRHESENDFNRLFSLKSTFPKLYSWSFSFLDDARFSKEGCHSKTNKALLTFSFLRESDLLLFKTAIKHQISLGYQLFGYPISLVSIKEDTNHNMNRAILVSIKSDVLVKGGTHKYSDVFDVKSLKRTLKNKISYSGFPISSTDVDNLAIVPVGLVPHFNYIYGNSVPCFSGKLALAGNPKLLDFILCTGLGTNTGSGFGLVKQVKNK